MRPVDAVVLCPHDDVAVLLHAVDAGRRLVVGGCADAEALESSVGLPLGHKIAIRKLPAGSLVRKHGEVIGRLTLPVACGDHVHVHNLASLRGQTDGSAAMNERAG